MNCLNITGGTCPAGDRSGGGSLFHGNAVFGAIFNGLVDIIVGVVIKEQNINKPGIINSKRMGRQLHTDFTKNTAADFNNRGAHENISFLS